MNTQIIKVYYGSDALPYKDKERTVHFPITGSTFVGSSDTTKIRFYVDGYLADENALWISVSKRADGTQGSQFLTTGTDGDGDKYREMTLSGWYTAKKGDLYISLKGYQGGSTGYWDDDTGMYVVQGVPVIRATGSIKLAINYAPVGEYPYYQDEMATFQDVVAQLSDKLNITSGIKVVSSTSSIIVANEEEGQLFYSKADKKLYQLVSGNIVVFFETYDKDALDTKFSGKVDKLTTAGEYAYTHKGSTQGQITVSGDVVYSGIPRRTSSGQLKVPTTPTDNSHATSKSYVDNAISSAVSSVYKYKGSVATYSALPTTGQEIGDVYNVEDTGDNYAWTGTAWDKLSGTVDLSGYYTQTQTDALLDTKADKSTTYTKEQTDNLLQNYAHANGTYPNMTVGKSLTTKQIENISEDTGSTQTNPFLFQGTGTDDNTTETPTAPVAKHLELRGNTVKWNQGARELTSSYWDYTNATVSFSDGVATVTALDQYGQIRSNYQTIAGHKYLLRATIKKSNANTDVRLALYDGYLRNFGESEATTETQILYGFWTVSQVQTYNTISVADWGTENHEAFEVKDFQIFDLTDIYGAGKEPTTYLQFVRDYPLPYYAYNAVELKSCSSIKLITTGRNQFDESTIILGQSISTLDGRTYNNENAVRSDFIKVISGQTYTIYVGGTHTSIYYCEYDINDNFIQGTGATSGTPITLSNNTYYIRFSVQGYGTSYNNDICFYITWDGSKTGYVPYVKHEYDLPSEELRSAGSAYDTITPNGVHTQRIGTYTFTGQEACSYSSDGDRYFVTLTSELSNAKPKTQSDGGSDILWGKYTKLTRVSSTYGIDGIYLYTDIATGNIYFQIRYSGVITSEQEALSYLAGTTIYYELGTPIITEASSFAENIEVDDFGTMEFVPSDSTEAVIVPQGNRFFYPADYVLFIDDLYEISKDGGETSDANNFVTQSELQTAIGQIPTDDFGFPIITAPSSTTLTNEIRDKIVNGCFINGTFLTYDNIIFFPALLYNGTYYGTYYVGGRPSRMGTYQINASNVIALTSDKNLRLEGIDRINGKAIPNYPSDTGTFVLKCVNGTLTWVAE